MKLHPRHSIVAKAKLHISQEIVKAWDRGGLTAIEIVTILAQLQIDYVKYALRHERHPHDRDKKADEE